MIRVWCGQIRKCRKFSSPLAQPVTLIPILSSRLTRHPNPQPTSHAASHLAANHRRAASHCRVVSRAQPCGSLQLFSSSAHRAAAAWGHRHPIGLVVATAC
ncbi:hypothetical protein GUJ93_ZPchr0008g12265 [Zizania palustris]|uniref:Uncharacterized protein n=1 Tax=Zizania palustris TaxID=103762 RepID=A0A8J5RAV0_ZIZPA|nr:hypothetical protein GUJ93_ZPchr0008g12265 [Zizania palustris]